MSIGVRPTLDIALAAAEHALTGPEVVEGVTGSVAVVGIVLPGVSFDASLANVEEMLQLDPGLVSVLSYSAKAMGY